MTDDVGTTSGPRRLPPWLVPTVVGVILLLAIAVVVAIVIALRQTPPPVASPEPRGPSAMTADGGIRFEGVDGAIVVGDPTSAPASPTVTSYVDWACPACRSFEGAYAGELAARVAAGELSLEIHPIAILDRYFQGSEYSSRAANAAACVAEHSPDDFLGVQYAFFAAQPDEGTAGYTDEQLVELLDLAQLADPDVIACVETGEFRAWVASTTAAAVANPALQGPDGGFGTPTVLIDGERWNPAVDGDLLALLDAR